MKIQKNKNSLKNTATLKLPRSHSRVQKKIPQQSKPKSLRKSGKPRGEYHKLGLVGKGAFSRVWLVQDGQGRQFAMKQMSKVLVMQKDSVENIINQRKLLEKLQHSFLINIHKAFQDNNFLYLVLQYASGGDLRSHMQKHKFTEDQTRFIIANLLSALQYLHSQGIIHRDIKPQNIVLDSSNYARLTDLGISRQVGTVMDSSGTPGYMSPQAICNHQQSFTSDYFAIGVIGYQLILGKRPYSGKTRKQIRDKILHGKVVISLAEIPDDWSIQAVDFINRLLERRPQQRLGVKGIGQIKSHPFLKGFNWKQLQQKKLKPAYKGKVDWMQKRSPVKEVWQELKGNEWNKFQGYTYKGECKTVKLQYF